MTILHVVLIAILIPLYAGIIVLNLSTAWNRKQTHLWRTDFTAARQRDLHRPWYVRITDRLP